MLKLVQRPKSPNWIIRGTIRGLSIEESTGFSDRKAAEEVFIKRAAELQQRAIHGDAATRSFAEAALSYIEAGGERLHLEPLLRHFGTAKLVAIGQAEIDDAAKKLCAGRSNSTANRKVYTPAVAILRHAARKKWCPKPVVARPKQPQGRHRWINYGEAKRLIAAASPHLRPLVIFLLSTGARLSEALYLDWRNVDLERREAVFVDTKNGEKRGVPLNQEALAALANLPWERNGNVFRKPMGSTKGGRQRKWAPYEQRDGGGGQIKTAWAGMLRRAGIADFTPHDCRHTWATWHYMANRDLQALMALGGWKSPQMVFRYAHVNTSHLAQSVENLWGKHGEDVVASSQKPLANKAS